MREQLKLLEELQRHDARLQEFETALKNLPEKLQALRNDLGRMEALLAKECQGLAETEKFRQDQEAQKKVDEGNIARAKAKLQQVRTGKEYMAAQREIESTRRIVAEREEEIRKLDEAITATKTTIASHEADVATLREHVAREEEATNGRLEELRAATAGDRAARAEMAAKVSPTVLKRYDHVRAHRGVALVAVVNGTCQGCHMAIPPQLFNILQRGDSLEACPSCHRLVYWDGLFKDEALEQGEQPEPVAAAVASSEK